MRDFQTDLDALPHFFAERKLCSRIFSPTPLFSTHAVFLIDLTSTACCFNYGISGANKNLPVREIAVDFFYSLKTKRRFNSHAQCTVNVIIVCCEDIYGRQCVKKSNNDYFHPQVVIVVFNKKKLFIFCCQE